MTTAPRARPSFFLFILACAMAVQLALLALSMPLSKVLSAEHSYYIDNPYHVYQLELGRALLKQGQLLGYDPMLGAGHLGGANDNLSARGPVIMAAVLPDSMSSSVIYNLYVLLCALAFPLTLAALARLLRWPAAHTALAMALGVVAWWVGALHWFHTAGMVSFVAVCYFALPYTAWLWRLCGGGDDQREGGSLRLAGALALAGVLGGLAVWLHPLFPVVVAILFAGFLACGWPVAAGALLLRGAAVSVLVVLVNLPWVAAVQGQRDISAYMGNLHPYQKAVGAAVALKPAVGIWDGGALGSLLNPLMLLACAAGLYFLPAERRRRFLPLLAGGVLMVLFSAFGAAIPGVGQLQPNRFLAPAFLLIAMAGAYNLGECVAWLRLPGRRALKLAVAAGIALAVLYFCREMLREASPGPHGHYGKAPPELTAEPKVVAELEAWIRANTTADGRIVFETSHARVHGGGHVAGLIALKTGRELIGAAYPYSLPDVSFWDRSAFGKPIKDVSPGQLWQGLELYNVGWVAAHSPELKRAMAALPQAAAVADIGPVRMFRLQRPLSYVLAGQATIAGRGFNRVDVSGAAGSELVLRYHWLPGLAASAGAVVEAAPSAPGFPPFIRVRNPPAAFTLSLPR